MKKSGFILSLLLLLSIGLSSISYADSSTIVSSPALTRIESKIKLFEFERKVCLQELAFYNDQKNIMSDAEREKEIDIFSNGLAEAQTKINYWKAQKAKVLAAQ